MTVAPLGVEVKLTVSPVLSGALGCGGVGGGDFGVQLLQIVNKSAKKAVRSPPAGRSFGRLIGSHRAGT